MRVLYLSEMAVSPLSGGGYTALNLLEPNPEHSVVLYASPRPSGSETPWFPELRSRLKPLVAGHMASLPGSRFALVRHINAAIHTATQPTVARRLHTASVELIAAEGIDVVLAVPQGRLDLSVAAELSGRVPTAVWFMDDYYRTSPKLQSQAEQLWRRSATRLVISEAMRDSFIEMWGGMAMVVNNAVDFPPYSRPSNRGPLRIAYAGALNPYYLEVFRSVIGELGRLAARVELDVFSVDRPVEPEAGGRWTYRTPLPEPELITALGSYDVLLIMSSFDEHHRRLAETSLASKWASYLAAGRCIVAYGPEYAENVRYLRHHELGVAATNLGAFTEVLDRLAADPILRLRLGAHAYKFGIRHRSRPVVRARMWSLLENAVHSPHG